MLSKCLPQATKKSKMAEPSVIILRANVLLFIPRLIQGRFLKNCPTEHQTCQTFMILFLIKKKGFMQGCFWSDIYSSWRSIFNILNTQIGPHKNAVLCCAKYFLNYINHSNATFRNSRLAIFTNLMLDKWLPISKSHEIKKLTTRHLRSSKLR